MKLLPSLIPALFLVSPAFSAPDTVDTNFAQTAGQVFHAPEYGGISSVLVQPDGKILFGSNEIPGTVNGTPLALPLIRFNPDGTVDNTFFADNQEFGSDAGIYYDAEGWPEVHALGLLSDGKIVAAGVMQGVRTGTVANPGTFLQSNSIVRFNPDGTIDTTFQTAGTTPWPTGGLNYIEHVVIQPDDKILALGGFGGFRNSSASPTIIRYGIARLNLDGSVDTSFQLNPAEFGVPAGAFNVRGWFREASLDAAGRIYVVGELEWGNAFPPAGTIKVLARLNPDGSRDPSFNPTIPTNVNGFQNVLVEPSGNVTVIGGLTNNNTWMARFQPNGSPDPTFTLAPSLTYISARPLEIDAAGRYLLATRGATTNLDRLVRINNNGSIDSTFDASASYNNGPNGVSFGYFGTFTTAPSGKIYSGSFFDIVEGVGTVKVVAFEGDFNPASTGQIQFAATGFSATEQSGVLRVAVTRSGGVSGAASATLSLTHLTTSGADFGTLPTSVSFADGSGGTQYLDFPITSDNLAEAIETATLTLTNITGATPGPRVSSPLTLIDSDSAPIITQHPQTLFVAPGSPFTLTVGVTSGATPVTYQWFRNGNPIPGATLPLYSITQADAALHAGNYTVEVTNPNGTTPSSIGVVTVKNPAILSFATPTATAIESDGTLTLTLQRGGSDVGEVSVDVTLVPGTATAPDDFTAATTTVSWANGDSTNKTVIISLTNDAIAEPIETFQAILQNYSLDTTPGTNTTVTITLLDDDSGPAITQPLVTRRVVNGWPATLSVAAQSQTALSYQWFKNGVAIPGAESSSLSFSPVTLTDFAYYSVEITNLAGTVTSGPVELGQRPNPLTPVSLDLTISSNQFSGIIARNGGGYYIFGAFTSVPTSGGTVSAQRLLRTNPNGTVDTTFLPAPNSTVTHAVELPDGSIVIGGGFTLIGVVSTPGGLARILPNGTVDSSFNDNLPSGLGSLRDLTVGPDGKIYLTHANGVDRLNPDGTHDPAFRASVIGNFLTANTYNTVAFGPNGELYLAGRFEVAQFTNRNLVKLNPNGTLDPTWKFTYGNSTFSRIGIQPDGKLIVQGNNASSLIRLLPDGTTDTSFTTVTGVQNTVYAVAADGSIYSPNGTNTNTTLRRHLPNGAPDTTFNNGTNPAYIATISSIRSLADGAIALNSSLLTGELRRIQITAQPQNLVADPGADVSFSVNASSVLPLTYQWSKNGTPIPGATLPTLPLADVTTANDGSYTVTISAPGLTSLTSSAATLTVRDAPAIVSIPGETQLLSGQALTLPVNWIGLEPATFIWFRNGQVVPGQETATLSIPSPAASDSGLYTLQITNAQGTVTTAPILVNITLDPAALAPGYIVAAGGTNPSVTSIIPESGGAYLYFSGSITHPSGSYSSILERIEPNGNIREPFTSALTTFVQGIARDAATGNLYPFGTNVYINSSGPHRLTRLNAEGTADTTFTTNAGAVLNPLNFNPYSAAIDSNGRILIGGINQLVRLNADGTLHTNLNSVVNSLSFIYQIEPQADGKTLVLGQSGMRRLLADGTLDPSFIFPTFPSLALTQFTRDALGNIYFNRTDGINQVITKLSPDGALLTNIAFPSTTYNSINRILSTPDGSLYVAHNNGKRLLRLKPDGTPDPLFNISGVGFNSTVSALAFASDGSLWVGGSFTQFNGTNTRGIVRLNGSPLDIVVTSQPASLTRDVGISAQFSVAATGANAAPLTYLWRKNGIPLVNGGNISGATTNTLTIAHTELSDAATYDVLITNTLTGRPLASSPATLTVLRQPEQLALTSALNLEVGNALTLSVEARGAGTLAYQWFRNGVPIIGANSATYQLSPATIANSGLYAVQVSNVYGNFTAEIPVTVTLPAGGIRYTTPNVTFGSSVNAILPLPDGRTLVGGAFTSVTFNSVNYSGIDELALLDAAGNLVTTFDLNPNGTVNSLALMPDGGVLVGGNFTQIGGQNRTRLARLNPDLALDTTWSPGTGANNTINAIVATPTGFYLGGNFTSYNSNTALAYVCRILPDGSPDPTFTPPALGNINALARDGEGVLVGGTFTLTNTPVGINQVGIARLNADGSHDTTFTSSMEFSTTTFAIAKLLDGKWLASGSSGRIRRFNTNGSHDSTWVTAANAQDVRALAVQRDGRIIVGGNFTTLAGQSINRLGRLNPNGTLDTTFAGGTGADASVLTIALSPLGDIHIGGSFSNYRSEQRGRYARLNGNPLSLGIASHPVTRVVNPGQPATFSVIAMATDAITYQWRKNGVALSNGGDISGATTATLTIANAEDADEGNYDVVLTHNGDASTLTANAAPLIVLGSPEILAQPTPTTTEAGSSAVFSVIARGVATLGYQWYRGSTLLTDGPGISGATTHTLTLSGLTTADSGNVRVVVTNGLGFAESSPVALLVVRPSHGTNPEIVPPVSVNGVINDVVPFTDGSYLIAGAFTTVGHTGGSVSRNRIAKFNANGSLDTTAVQINGSNNVEVMARDSLGRIYIGGAFTTINTGSGNVTRNRIARLNANLTLDTTFNTPGTGPNNTVTAILPLADGKVLIGGAFTSVNEASGTAYIARLNEDGTIDGTFTSGASSGVSSIEPAGDGTFWLSHLLSYGGQTNLVRINAAGTRVPEFSYTANMTSGRVIPQPDGTVLSISTNFPYIQKIASSGALVSGWPVINTSQRTNQGITAAATWSDSRSIIAGSFTSYDGVTRNLIALINGNGSLDTSFSPGTGFTNAPTRIRLDASGRAWIVGNFTTYRGVTVPRMVVLNAFSPDPAAPPADPFLPFVASLPEGQRGETDDPDGDNIPNLLEFVFGSNPGSFTPMPAMPASSALGSAISGSLDPAKTYRIVELETPKNTQGVAITLGASQDLTFTDGATATEFGARTDNGATETRRYYLTPAIDDAPKLFWRIEGTR